MVYPYSGQWFFDMTRTVASPSGALATRILYQDVDISAYSVEVNAGLLMVKATTHVQTEDVSYLSGKDYGQMTIYLLDQQQHTLDTFSTGLVYTPNLTWVQKSLSKMAAPGTRSIRIELLGEKHETEYINAFFDDVGLRISVIPEPATVALMLIGIVAIRQQHRLLL
jgi:hypothetical protein